MWVTKLLIFPVEIRICCPKTTKFGPKLAFLVNLGQARPGRLIHTLLWVGWWLWRAGCISQDTYLLYSYLYFCMDHFIFDISPSKQQINIVHLCTTDKVIKLIKLKEKLSNNAGLPSIFLCAGPNDWVYFPRVAYSIQSHRRPQLLPWLVSPSCIPSYHDHCRSYFILCMDRL